MVIYICVQQQDPVQQNSLCQPESFFVYFHNNVTISAPSLNVNTIRSSLYAEFLSYKNVKIYYDNGQVEVSKILSSVFNALLPNVEFRKVMPSQYKLFQVADLLCTMYLIQLKMEDNHLSKSELTFFGNQRDLKKNYLKPLSQKEWVP